VLRPRSTCERRGEFRIADFGLRIESEVKFVAGVFSFRNPRSQIRNR
jgi:hypothetical protein